MTQELHTKSRTGLWSSPVRLLRIGELGPQDVGRAQTLRALLALKLYGFAFV
jgi:hypothetical protein